MGVGHDFGLVVSPGDIEANATSLWKNSAQSRLTVAVRCLLISAGKLDGSGWEVAMEIKQRRLE